MKDILDALDTYLLANLGLPSPEPAVKYWGLSELSTKSTERFPVTINDRDRVSIDQRYDVISYHRIVTGNLEDSEEWSFGSSLAKEFSITVRTVLMHKISVGEDFRYDFFGSFPDLLTIPGYEFVFLNSGSINEDHEGIVTEEFTEIPYEKHRLPWNVSAKDTVVQYVKCRVEV